MIGKDAPFSPDDFKYAPYYIKQEGDFLYNYFLVGMIVFVMILIVSAILGATLCMGSSAFSLKLVEESLKNIDALPAMMKAQQKKNRDDGFSRQRDEESRTGEE